MPSPVNGRLWVVGTLCRARTTSDGMFQRIDASEGVETIRLGADAKRSAV